LQLVVKHLRANAFVPALLLLTALVIWLALMREFRLDDSFITYRYARNAAQGLGLVYNQGDAVLSTTAPLYALLLAALSRFIPDFHILGGLIGTISIGLGGLVIYALPRNLPPLLRFWGGLLYVISTPLWLALGMETPLWILLVLLAVWSAGQERWSLSGLLVGVAVLVRPDAALPGVLLGGLALLTAANRIGTNRRWWRALVGYVAVTAVPVLIFALWALLTYGSPFPATLSAKSAQAVRGVTGLGLNVGTFDGLVLIIGNLLQQSPLYVLIGLLALIGLRACLPWTVVLIVVWGVLHLMAYAVLGIAPYRWYYAPLLPSIILLSMYGVQAVAEILAKRLKYGYRLAGAAAFLTVIAPLMSWSAIAATFAVGAPVQPMLPIVDWEAYRQVGDWLRTETPADATVGLAEVGQVGFYAERWMTDYLGLLQPDVADMLERGDLYSWLVGYAPDYLVFQRFRGIGLVLYNVYIQEDPWFLASYAPIKDFDDPRYAAGPVTIFQRVNPKREMIEQSVQADYGTIRLTSLAVERTTVGTATVRVRLDWQMTGVLPPITHLAVKVLDIQGALPAFDADYETTYWEGTFSTWHTLMLPADLPPGEYPLLVSVGADGVFNEQTPAVLLILP
jgi:arabinofuranosyltransferase